MTGVADGAGGSGAKSKKPIGTPIRVPFYLKKKKLIRKGLNFIEEKKIVLTIPTPRLVIIVFFGVNFSEFVCGSKITTG